MASIQFLGAAGTVTGSKYLFINGEHNILVDCGLFQGIKNLREKNREKLPINVQSIHSVVITHAHLDHCGYIPVLVKQGYTGKFLMTPPTRDLVELILLDSAKIQEEEAKHANEEGYSKHSPALPLYTIVEVEQCLERFETHFDEEWVHLSQNVAFQFIKNGHILGSCSIEIKSFDKKIVFSGDIGRANDALLPPPTPMKGGDIVVMESTYGDRLHPNEDALDLLEEVILTTYKRGGNLIIPSFAVGRAQEIMFLINELKQQKRISDIPVYLDSPMGTSATEIFLKYSHWHKLAPKQAYQIDRHVTFVKDMKDTFKVINNEKHKIIIAASGMITGGRVLSYIKELGWNPLNTILLVGYQGEGTRGRSLKEGARELKIRGKYIQIGAEVRTIDCLSAHADQAGMIEWLKGMNQLPEQLFLVHGEPSAQNSFRVKIQDELGLNVVIPSLYEEIQF